MFAFYQSMGRFRDLARNVAARFTDRIMLAAINR